MADLFGHEPTQSPSHKIPDLELPLHSLPLAARMRPAVLEEYIGQEHLLGEGKPLREAIHQGKPHSMIFWGPPGTGKTTLAKLLANSVDYDFVTLSAVLSGVKDIREAVKQAQQRWASLNSGTILFVDEVHRFNKSQQDAFLPHVEDGTIVFVGATTENPSFELNNALLSRCRVYKLQSLEQGDIEQVVDGALNDYDRGLGGMGFTLDEKARSMLVGGADGDARKALNLLEVASDFAETQGDTQRITEAVATEILRGDVRQFDKGGDHFYDQISALHKSVRGSSPDASLYWFARMLDGGCDPLYIARRVVRMASEDIGNADPRGLELALNAWQVQERLGSPEGELAIAQAITYLAAAPKSNAVYNAFNRVMADVRSQPSYEVPLHLRNAPTSLMKDMGHGDEYRYAHAEDGGFAAGENYFPEEIEGNRYYEPTDRGLEQKIKDKLEHLSQLNEASAQKRYK